VTYTEARTPRQWNPRNWPVDPRVFLGGLPLVAFILGHQVGDAYTAIIAALLASIFVYLIGSRRGALGLLALFFFFTTLTWAVIGLLMGDERAYLTQEGMRDFVSAGMAVTTVIIRRPLFALVIREMAPSLERLLPRAHPVFAWTTLFWAAVNVVQGIVRIGMLNSDLSVGEYLLWSRAFAWPTTLLMYGIIVLVVWRVVVNERRKTEAAEVSVAA
jgi:hypothetical protein